MSIKEFNAEQEREELIHAIRFPTDYGLERDASVHRVVQHMWHRGTVERGYPIDADEWLIALLEQKSEPYIFLAVDYALEDGETSTVVIKATRIPTIEELNNWLNADPLRPHIDAYSCHQILRSEVYLHYNTDGIDFWPVYGK